MYVSVYIYVSVGMSVCMGMYVCECVYICKCGFVSVGVFVCMGVYVLWEWGRKANFFFSKWYWIQKQMKRLKSADPNMSVNFKIYFKATKDLTK